MPVDAPWAPSLAVATGSATGALFSLYIDGGSELLTHALLGAALGVVSQQLSSDFQRADAQHQRRWSRMNRYPEGRQWLQDRGIGFDDREALHETERHLDGALHLIVNHFKGYCRTHGLVCEPQALEKIVAFCEAHGFQRGPFLKLSPERGRFYLAAVEESAVEELNRELDAGRLPAAVFRNRGFAHITAALQYQQGATRPRCDVQSFTPETEDWSLQTPLADCYQPSQEPAVLVQRHRHARAGTVRAPVAPPRAVPCAASPRAAVRWGPVLVEQCEQLDPNGVTLRRIGVIRADLLDGRQPGHAIRRLGCMSVDVTLDGMAGRNAWRLLYRHDARGIEMIGIADYHVAAGRAIRWWEG